VLFRQDLTVRAFRNSMLLAGGAALSLAVIALVSAYVLDRAKPKARVVAFALVELPYAVPGIVLAISCILLFIKPLPLIGVSIYATPWIILFAYHARFFAIALKPVMAAMATLDDAVQEAAVCDGARLGQRLRHIVLPLVFPAVFAGMLMVFLLAFNELTVSALLWSAGTETLGVALLSLEDSGLGARSGSRCGYGNAAGARADAGHADAGAPAARQCAALAGARRSGQGAARIGRGPAIRPEMSLRFMFFDWFISGGTAMPRR
jgi:iron(III) transport system permease protein